MRNQPLASKSPRRVLLQICAIAWAGVAAAASDLSREELRYLAIETTVALQADSQTAEYDFKVEPQDQSLVLVGEVADGATRTLVERIAQTVCFDYDVEIVNRIRVKANEARPASEATDAPTPLDREQMEKLQGVLESEFPDLADNVSVNFELQPMPTIVLEGLVASYEQKLEISRVVRREYQRLPVLNNLQVRRQQVGERTVYAISPKESQTVIVEKSAIETADVERPRRLTDQQLSETLAAVLQDDPVIQDAIIKLRVEDGVVWVSGQVASVGQKIRTLRLVEEQPGVRYAVDQLMVALAELPDETVTRTPEPKDVTFQLRRAIVRRIPALAGSKIEILDRTIIITPTTEKPFARAEISALEARLSKIPEAKGFTFVVRPRVSVFGPQAR